jgi:hypothetical protein
VLGALARERPDLDDAALLRYTAVLRALMSLEVWSRLTRDFGLSPEDAGDAAAWAFASLVATIRQEA